jgi:hypothetical protein
MKNPGLLEIKTLKGDWADKDFVMLHACFQLLVNCIEEENLLVGHIDWNENDAVRKAKIVIEELYFWWKQRIEIDSNGRIKDLDSTQYEEDDLMLIKLISVRKYLWT